MLVAHFHLTKPILWLVSPSDPVLAPLRYLAGWSVVHPLIRLTPEERDEPVRQLPTGEGRTTVSRHALHCVVPEVQDASSLHRDIFEKMRNLLPRLRYVSRQATLPGENDFASFRASEVRQLPTVEFQEPYFGEVHFGDSADLPTALTMELVV